MAVILDHEWWIEVIWVVAWAAQVEVDTRWNGAGAGHGEPGMEQISKVDLQTCGCHHSKRKVI